MPYVTGFFLVLGGMLIGFFLWYRDRTQEEKRRRHLDQENSDLKNEALRQRASHAELEEQLARQQAQLSVLEQLCDEWATSRESLFRERAQLEAEVGAQRRGLEVAAADSQREKQLRVNLEDQLHRQLDDHRQELESSDSAWRRKHVQANSQAAAYAAQLDQLANQHDRTAQRLHEAQSANAALKSELATRDSMLETAKRNASGLEQEYVSLESALRENNDSLKQARGQLAAALSANQDVKEKAEELNRQLQQKKEEISRLQEIAADASSLKEQRDALEESLASGTARLEQVISQRDHALCAARETTQNAAGLRKRIENQQNTLQQLRKEKEQALQNLKGEIDRRLKLEDSFVEQKKELQSDFERRSAEQSASIAQLENDNVELLKNLKLEQQNRGDLETQLVELSSRTRRLTQETALMEELKSRLAAALRQSAEFESRLQHLTDQRDQSLSELNGLRNEMKLLQSRAKANQETIRALRRERSAVMARVANPTFASTAPTFLSLTQTTANDARTVSGTIRQDPLLGSIYVRPPRIKDDLKMISGIADVLERRLNDLGIYTYEQVMNWDDKAIAEFSQMLAFKDRIQRDDWVGQARRLFEQRRRRAA